MLKKRSQMHLIKLLTRKVSSTILLLLTLNYCHCQTTAPICDSENCDTCNIKLEGVDYIMSPNPVCMLNYYYDIGYDNMDERVAIYFIFAEDEKDSKINFQRLKTKIPLSPKDEEKLISILREVKVEATCNFDYPYKKSVVIPLFFKFEAKLKVLTKEERARKKKLH